MNPMNLNNANLTLTPSRKPRGALSGLALFGTTALLVASLAGCGGGGGGESSPTSTPTPPPTPTPTPMASVGQPNVLAVYIDAGPPGGGSTANVLYADILVCAPSSTSNCSVVDHMLVDTGSTGTRVLASALPASLLAALPQSAAGANKVGECLSFASGVTWGSVRSADVHMGGVSYEGENAANSKIQVIGDTDSSVANIPGSCYSQGSVMQTVGTLGAKGILGVGLFKQDCGSACASNALAVYYSCSAGGCSPTTMPTENQIANPIALFAFDNNGNTLKMPSVSGGYANTLNGMMVFGIGTAANNALAYGSTVLGANSSGYFRTVFNGNTLPNSFIDSGSSINFFPAGGNTPFAVCSSSSTFFCPASPVTMSASNTGTFSTWSTASVYTVNAGTVFNAAPTANAYMGLSGPSSSSSNSLDYGASFFLGRSIATLIEGNRADGFSVSGPAFAHTP